MDDRSGSFLGYMSEDKMRIKESCWSMRMIYGPRGLAGVSTVVSGVDKVSQQSFANALFRHLKSLYIKHHYTCPMC
jgi:hypothetical protein